MKIAFLVSSAGDTNLALKTIEALEQQAQLETLLIALTKTAQQRIQSFKSTSLTTKMSPPETLPAEEQLSWVKKYIEDENVNYVYLGVPSINDEKPFQMALALENVPIIVAYEFMFKPEDHCLWQYVDDLKSRSNIQWALPLDSAKNDFDIRDDSKVHITGHLSIDNADTTAPLMSKSPQTIREQLQVPADQSLAFLTSTTQPTLTDTTFLDTLLAELPNHPVQLRLGLHPDIPNFDDYMRELLAVYKKHPKAKDQFKIILPEQLLIKFQKPALSINDPEFQSLFLRVNVNGNEAAFAADRVAQAVPGALLNQAAFEGKPAWHAVKAYLPTDYYSNDAPTFFAESRKPTRKRAELALDEKTTAQRYADIILKL
jgi:hypothetical protein